MAILLGLFSFLGDIERRPCRVEVEIALDVCIDSPLLVKKSLWYSYLRPCVSTLSSILGLCCLGTVFIFTL